MEQSLLEHAIATVPPGKWAVAVSGGADSVALLSLLRNRSDLSLCVVHFDHQTRDGQSTEDARFVHQLAQAAGLPFRVCRRDQLESDPAAQNRLPANLSARFRALRLEWFHRVVTQDQLAGVILAHHADDQAETMLLRLLRGSGFAGLTGMSRESTFGGLKILRPLLAAPRDALREYLTSIQQPWREDSSNQSPRYARSRVRRVLHERPQLRDALCELGAACRSLRDWTAASAPTLSPQFSCERLAALPALLARRSAARWLAARGAAGGKLTPATLDRLSQMASDAATPPRQQFPGGVTICRRGGVIFRD